MLPARQASTWWCKCPGWSLIPSPRPCRMIGRGGALHFAHDRDEQLYGETFLLVQASTSLMVPFIADAGGLAERYRCDR